VFGGINICNTHPVARQQITLFHYKHALLEQYTEFYVCLAIFSSHHSLDHFPMTSRIRGSLIITPWIMPGGAVRAVKCIAFYGKNPTSTSIPARKLRLGIATHGRTALFVEQRERFHLPFVATSYDLPSWRYSLLEITLSIQNAQSVPILVSRPCTRDFWRSRLAQSDEPRPCWQRLSVGELSKVNKPALVKHSRHCPTKLVSQTLKCYHHGRGSSL